MSDLLFNRNIRVTFGKVGQTLTRVSDLFIQFDLEKNSESEPNKGAIQINNLNRDSRALLQAQDVSVLLEVGYAGIYDKLAVGQISRAPTERSRMETVTKIEFEDGRKQYTEARINTSFAPGVTTKQVLESLASELKVGIGTIKGTIEEAFQNGLTLSTNVRAALDDITGKMGVEWSIQDNNLQILPRNTPSELLGILLTPETGLVESPIEREDAKKGGKFIEFKSLMRAQLKPGVAVEIQSRETSGFFKIRKARYQGDNRKGPFHVSCEAVEVESGAIQSSDLLNIVDTGVVQALA